METAKIYQLGKTRTNKGIKLRHGSQERVFRYLISYFSKLSSFKIFIYYEFYSLEFVSNQDFSENEFLKWRDACDAANISMPTTELLENKLRVIIRFI